MLIVEQCWQGSGATMEQDLSQVNVVTEQGYSRALYLAFFLFSYFTFSDWKEFFLCPTSSTLNLIFSNKIPAIFVDGSATLVLLKWGQGFS